jgi:hypothetical protein
MLEKGKKRTRKKAPSGAAHTAPPAAPPAPAAGERAPGERPTAHAAPAAVERAPAQAALRPGTRPGPISAEERRKMVAEAAYFRAQRRGFQGGSPDRDWMEAEAEIDAILLDRR